MAGRVKSVRVQPRAGTSNLECVLTDGTGGLLLVFQGRPRIPGIEPGARLVAEGMVGAWGRRLAILNPDYELVGGPTDSKRSQRRGPRGRLPCPWAGRVAIVPAARWRRQASPGAPTSRPITDAGSAPQALRLRPTRHEKGSTSA